MSGGNASDVRVDRAAMLRQFAALPPPLRLGFITAALHVHTAGADSGRAVNVFASGLAKIDRREARRKSKRVHAHRPG
jgi:hypothetical protein